MHRYVAGSCRIALRLTPRGPWLVRGLVEREALNDRGRETTREVLQPLRDAAGRPLLPASSLKGVLRSTAERILRSVDPERDPALAPLADTPFVSSLRVAAEEGGRQSIGRNLPPERGRIADSDLLAWLEEQSGGSAEALAQRLARLYPTFDPEVVPASQRNRLDAWLCALQPRIYPLLSPASQLFGCTLHAGLLTIDDARAPDETLQRRSHVAIDRFSGGVGEGPFVEDLAPAGTPLSTTLTLTNFALWQLGLLALTFQELARGYVGLGGGTRKGQGQIELAVPSISLSYAAAAYDHPGRSGVVSAQARLARPPFAGLAEDVPPEVVTAEGDLALLADQLRPAEPASWRDQGTVRLELDAGQAHALLRETVRQAWAPYIAAQTGRAA